ncbi:MAG TPA: hypothetical protein VJP05_08375 [Acidimicrobiia bacterium]|nr:hypothetical protein [Acidimicrobiia bacterium]
MSLALLMPVSLGAAVATGSRALLIGNLIVDVLIGGYIAVLLRIKQGQQPPPWRTAADDEDVKVSF